MKKLVILLAIVAAGIAAQAQTKWSIDQAHSTIGFSVKHLVIAEVDGRFTDYTATITADKDDFSDIKIDFTAFVSSINTNNKMRDKHLKSDDFFNAELYPEIKFESTSFKKTGDNQYILEGFLTIRDVTKLIKLDVVYNGTVKDPSGETKAGFKATGVINRFDYNLKWNTMADATPVVGKEVTFNITIELKKNR